MNEKNILQFNLLKKKISERFLQDFPGTNSDISQWKGIDIVYFQEHLLKKVKGNVSEKWFYTYFKQNIEKLPRIDMLNLLSEYVGYKSWSHFLNENPIEIDSKIEFDNPLSNENQYLETKNTTTSINNLKSNQKTNLNSKIAKWFSGIFGLVVTIFGINYALQPKEYVFCFNDSDTNLPIKNDLEITISKKGESSKKYLVKNSCFYYSTDEDTLEMTVNSKFHKETTFKYILNRYKENETIQLDQDEYALMLNYYVTSTQKIIDRQNKLRKLIANNALIYQVYDNEVYGVEVLTKEQYIGLLTLPTESLRKYVQLSSQTNENGKIVKIKFKIQNNEN